MTERHQVSGGGGLFGNSHPAGDVSIKFSRTGRVLNCHSVALSREPFFGNLFKSGLIEGTSRQVTIDEDEETFAEVMRFIHTGVMHVDDENVFQLLHVSDKYCMEDAGEYCVKYLSQRPQGSLPISGLAKFLQSPQSAFHLQVKEILLNALKISRDTFTAVFHDPSIFSLLPMPFMEELLSLDESAALSESEIFDAVMDWIVSKREVNVTEDKEILMRVLRKCRMSSIELTSTRVTKLLSTLGISITNFFRSENLIRSDGLIHDPPFAIQRGDPMVPAVLPTGSASANAAGGHFQDDIVMGARDLLQQEPGWVAAGVPVNATCHVNITCSSWSHRERRLLLRGSSKFGKSNSTAAARQHSGRASQRGGTPATIDRETSPSSQAAATGGGGVGLVRGSFGAMATFDQSSAAIGSALAAVSDSEGGRSISSLHSAPRTAPIPSVDPGGFQVDHEQIDHEVLIGIVCGHQRIGARISQPERTGVYRITDLEERQPVKYIGGTLTSLEFDFSISIGSPSSSNVCQCTISVHRGETVLLKDFLMVSSRVPTGLYVTSSHFDGTSTFSTRLKWKLPQTESM